MAERVGQGYVGQGLGIADLLAVLYFDEMKYDAKNLKWSDRDRFVLSIGHYSIGLYAALAEAGVIEIDELDTYGADESRLEMSGSEITPGFEMTGGSLGHGLGQAVGMALGLRLDKRQARIFTLLSDGELQEGATWEAAMAAAHYSLDGLFAFIDCNNQQADGPPARVLNVEPVHQKWEAFGWDTQRIDGNNIGALVDAIDRAKTVNGKPHAIVLDTLMGKGVRAFEQREKNHFIRVDASEWSALREQLESGMTPSGDERIS
ncbi:transketolase [Acidobacterium sp. S8]|uniref:transketolase n=1 Tax=Acidobacterium sp. S8 TaxID=1641854 RepID=UPI001C2047B2|nr:transketolase [Acidobacterium sp. S8]